MRNVFSQIIKTSLLYLAALILVYPFNIIICSITTSGLLWLFLLCLSMALTGVLIWFLLNHKYAVSLKGINIKQIQRKYYKDIGIQFLVVCFFFIMASIKEYNQIYYLPVEFYDFWNAIVKDEARAAFLSYRTLPMINGGYTLIISISWVFYNLTQFLFDKRIRF